jgi:hypothetical protein
MRKTIVGIFLALALVLTGCGAGSDPEQEQFEPVSYGNDRTEQCYFVNDPDEVIQLKADNKCEDDWNPAPWPEDDMAGFFPFFFFVGGNSGTHHHYRDRYVPAAKHASYNSKVTALNNNPVFKQKVATLSPNAKYRSTTTGKIVSGSAVKPGTFGGGSRFTGGYGTRSKTCSAVFGELPASFVLKGGGGGGSRGGSSGGGGSRSGGGGGSRTTSKTGTTSKTTKGGC